MSVRMIVDSTVDLTPEIQAQMQVVPLTIHFGEEEYIDGVTITGHEFYEKLVESEVLPTTSQATPFAFEKVFKEAVEAGDQVVMLTIAHTLSGTYQSASIAAMDYPGQVFVVDSNTVAIGSGILAEYALQLADSGMSAADIADRLNQVKDKVRIVAVLDTLEYLKRGGRISKAAAFAGGLLSIKPVVELKDGVINVMGKARGNKQGNSMLMKEVNNLGGLNFDMPILLGYTGLDDGLLKKFVEDDQELWQGRKLDAPLIGSVVGTHAGPGGVAVAFFLK